MQNVVTKHYELTYDNDQVIFVDKVNNEVIIRVFGDEIKKINIDAQNTNVNMNVKNLNIMSENHISMNSKLPKNVPSIFFNCEPEQKPAIIANLIDTHTNTRVSNLIGI